MKQKFTLSDCSSEEQENFMKEFTLLLEKNSLYFEPVPQFVRDTLESPWRIVTQIFLQKKTPVVEIGIPSTDPEINPAV